MGSTGQGSADQPPTATTATEASDAPATDASSAAGAPETVAVEFLIEPFTEGAPGEHVMAALDAFSQHGLDTDLGAFASVAEGDLDSVADAVSEMIRQAMSKGATSLRLHVGRDGSELMVAPLHDALDSMIRSVQREIGKPSEDWDRSEKQMAVRLLEDNGAFLLRGAVDDIARIMGVSRITIYNYLNAIDRKAQR